MKIEVLLFAHLKEAAEQDRLFLDVAEGTSLKELVQKLKNEPRFYKCKDLPFVYAVNESFVSEETVLREADVLALMTPVSGGAL